MVVWGFAGMVAQNLIISSITFRQAVFCTATYIDERLQNEKIREKVRTATKLRIDIQQLEPRADSALRWNVGPVLN